MRLPRIHAFSTAFQVFQQHASIASPTALPLFSQEETDILVRTAKSDPAFTQHAHAVGDPDGKKVKMALWNRPTDDVYGTVSRLPKVVDTLEHLLGDEVYHYHSKMVIKEPFTGGSFCWHQDYGYWYLNGCLFPDMASVMVAVDPNTRENGCLQVSDFQKVHKK
jgi:ectoine hydroxylase